MTGAAQQEGSLSVPNLAGNSSIRLSERGEHIFRQLLLERALATNDERSILKISRDITNSDSPSRPYLSQSSLLQAAIWLFSHEKNIEGERLAEKSATIYPDSLPLTVLLADIRLQQNKSDESLKIIEDFITRNPDNTEAVAEKGMIFLRCGKGQDALLAFESIPEEARTPVILFAYAQALNSARKFPEAEKHLRQAIHDAPEYAEARQLLALTLEECGKKEEARRLYADLLNETPKNVSARLFYLRSLLKDPDLDTAARILADAPAPESFTVSAIAMLIDEKKFDLAEKFLEKIEQIVDIPPTVSYYHAAFLVESGRSPQRALELLARVNPSSDNYENALKLRMRIHNEQKDYDSLLNVIGILRERHPEDVEPYLYAAEILCTRKKYSEAEKILSAAAERHPDNSQVAFQMAYIMEMMGIRSTAMERMEEVLKRFPDCVPALNYIGYNLADENRSLDRSLMLLTRAVELDPNSDFILDSMAWVLYRIGKYDEAWHFIEKAIAAASQNGSVDPTILEHAGDIAKAMKKNAEAVSAWTNAYKLINPETDSLTSHRLKLKIEGLHP